MNKNLFLEQIEYLRQEPTADPTAITAIESWILQADPIERQRINPFAIATYAELGLGVIVPQLLYGVKSGLFDLNWDAHCSHCDMVSTQHNTLTKMGGLYYCKMCEREFEGDFSERVEVTFSLNKAIEDLNLPPVCPPPPSVHPRFQMTVPYQQTAATEEALQAGIWRYAGAATISRSESACREGNNEPTSVSMWSKVLISGLILLGSASCANATNTPPPTVTTVISEASQPTATPLNTPTPEPTVITIETETTEAQKEQIMDIGEPGQITFHTLTMADDIELTYAVSLPADFEPSRRYPTLLALPPGPQTRDMVEWGMANYWSPQAMTRGWIVLSPIAPGGVLFFQGSERLIPEFLSRTATVYQPEGGKYFVGGISNGGISAFRVALNQPDLVHGLVVAPGFPRSEDKDRLALLATIPVAMYVGANDVSWVQQMEDTETALIALGGTVSLEMFAGEGHVIQGLSGGQQLFDMMESFR